MRTFIVLLGALLVIIGITLWIIFGHDQGFSQLFKKRFTKNHKKTETKIDYVVDPKIFLEGIDHIALHHPLLTKVKQAIHHHIVGMDGFINAILLNLLTRGNMLVEGFPGLAKSKTIHTLATILDLQFTRIQFTPDMLPGDIVGGEVYNQKTGEFEIKKGPIFTNILFADEINRTSPKVQSALLEAMQERQVSIGGTSFELPDPFFVLATQNPLEQEGTYPLPEAQIDRFLFKVLVNYPTRSQEKKVLDIYDQISEVHEKTLSHQDFLAMRKACEGVEVNDDIKHYITALVGATREPNDNLVYGASPRGSLGLLVAAKALAFAEGQDFVRFEHVQKVALSVLRHRIVLSYEAKVQGISEDHFLADLLGKVPLIG